MKTYIQRVSQKQTSLQSAEIFRKLEANNKIFMGNVCPTGSVAEFIIEEWDDQLPAAGCKPSVRSMIRGGS